VTQDQCRDVFLQQSITKNQGNHTRQTSKRQQQGKPFCTLTVTALGVHHSHTAGSNAEKEMSWRREEPATTSQIGLAVGCTKGANPRPGSANCNIETEKIEMLLGKPAGGGADIRREWKNSAHGRRRFGRCQPQLPTQAGTRPDRRRLRALARKTEEQVAAVLKRKIDSEGGCEIK
jgi:hypothetical protein